MSLHRIKLSKACPQCTRVGTLYLANVFVAKDVGDFSLAGQQLKLSVIERVVLACERCRFERVGHLEGAEISEDGTTFLSGHFVEDASE